MLETLVGKLKWEQTEGGIRIAIPSRFNWWLLYPGLGLFMLPHFAYEVLRKSGHTTAMAPRSFVPEWIGLALFVFWIALFRTHRCVLTLTSAELRVEEQALGLRLRTATRATSQISNLRFVPSQFGISVEDQSRVHFRVGKTTRIVGVGIGKEEADALIAKMLEVYPFPQRPPV
jgi:hypothetical protein